MSDPLAFFAADGSSSESEEEEDTNQNDQLQNDPVTGEDEVEKLPSPNTLFESVGRPSFLNNPNTKYINWDRFVKSSETDEPNIHESDEYAAIPPPSNLTNTGTVTTKLTRTILGSGRDDVVEFSSPPVQYTNTSVSSTERVSTESQPIKRPLQSNTTDEQSSTSSSDVPSSKRSKGEQFRVKEKRKRDIGQSSRGKNYVEEEKRILRQQYDSIPS